MRFLVDAQFPVRLAELLHGSGHDALHTSGLPDGNRTSDDEIARIADADVRVVVTKDRDFRDSHLLRGTPRRLLIVATGNVSNRVLLDLFGTNLPTIVTALEQASMVELRRDAVVLHRDE